MDRASEIDNSIYDGLGERWYTAYDDPIALLRAENEVMAPWIIQRVREEWPFEGVVLDVGCGAGLLSNVLAKAGMNVTGVDLSEGSLKVAREHDSTGTVKYLHADAAHLPFEDQSFEIVTAMDFLEHVENPGAMIKEFSRVLKPGGLFFFHTFNRNFLSWLVVIKAVELLVKNTPKNMHVLRYFIKPEEMEKYCSEAGLEVFTMTGLRPVLGSIPLKNIFSRTVPTGMQFELSPSLKLSYLGAARKKGNFLDLIQ